MPWLSKFWKIKIRNPYSPLHTFKKKNSFLEGLNCVVNTGTFIIFCPSIMTSAFSLVFGGMLVLIMPIVLSACTYTIGLVMVITFTVVLSFGLIFLGSRDLEDCAKTGSMTTIDWSYSCTDNTCRAYILSSSLCSLFEVFDS